jgi:glycosyltransferase involved in cell wall biosynthesis
LAIVHGFAFNLPLITTEHNFHSPEIEYISQQNGRMTSHNAQVYAAEIIQLLSEPALMKAMREHAKETARRLTLGASADRFIQAVDGLANPSARIPTDRRRFNGTITNRRINIA